MTALPPVFRRFFPFSRDAVETEILSLWQQRLKNKQTSFHVADFGCETWERELRLAQTRFAHHEALVKLLRDWIEFGPNE